MDNDMNEQELIDEFHKLFFERWNNYRRRWLGTHIVKYPCDMFLYPMIMYDKKPDFVIETGTYLGGSALFFASMCDIIGHGQVISVDRRELGRRPNHPRITYITGRCTAVDTLATVGEMVKGKTSMVVLDSDHRSSHVKRELTHYSPFVTKDQYLIVEDTFLGTKIKWKYSPDSPKIAVDWFLARNKDFVDDQLEKHYILSMCPGGFLRRVK